MFDPRDLACAIKALRGTRTQTSLAKSIGVSASTWCKWEQGGTTPRLVSVNRIAKALSCTIAEFREAALRCQDARTATEEGARKTRETQIQEDVHFLSLIQETDHMLRTVDRQLDTLLDSKNSLLRMRERLITPAGEPGG